MNNPQNSQRNSRHSLNLDQRSALKITAVEEVISFDETLISLSLGETVLNVSGDGLSIKNLSIEQGEVTVTGRVDAVVYYDDNPRRKKFGLFGRGQ